VGAVLAGGRSRRFGQDKALARVAGSSLLERAAASVASFTDELYLVAKQPEAYRGFGLPLLTDTYPARTPLSGILTAADLLREGDWLLLSACDIVVLEPELLRRLQGMRQAGRAAVLSRDGIPQPFPGFYPAECCAEFAAAYRTGEMHLQRIVERMPRRELPMDEAVCNVNRPEDLRRLEQLLHAGEQKERGAL
jgi:molybdopterin-guanine dinucleotide biosynthesis protein A